MLKNLLSKEGLITTNNFFDPCSHIKFISEEKSTLQRRQQSTHHEDLLSYPSTLVEVTQESWKKADEEQ